MLTEWERAALTGLLYGPVAVDGGAFVNGNHRTLAMLDVGVRRTVVTIFRER
ncbi:hypothetical protein AB0M46_42885 [Dactylosporangium sp. NPDC051485]|uniref:hypothetical protein n=1 Tax=Dactylosporangium sp. NPDC051485 TaxID=3154846 RepID=UPI0034386810